jgi:predicted ribosomally synthesized peptide with SipW-like signal peptide
MKMKMMNNVTNFVLNILRKNIHSLFRTNEGGSKIRKTRLKKSRKTCKGLLIAVQTVAVWYILILTGSYLTTDTGAYFNDVKKISGTITADEDFCKEKGSDYWHKYCKDNSGGGNGPDAPDVGTGKGNDPDNPGHNKGGCDDHTNAPCSDVTKIKGTHTSTSISLLWSDPDSTKKGFSFVKVYRNGNKDPVGNNIINGQFVDQNLLPSTKYSYKMTTVNKFGTESTGTTIEVTTSGDESDKN